MKMKIPLYVIVGNRPIMIQRNHEGHAGAYAFDWETGKFELNMSYFNRAYGGFAGEETELEELSKENFDKYVENLRFKISDNLQ